MSALSPIIRLFKQKEIQMEIENPPAIPTNQHPVLTALNEKIATLEAEVLKWKDEAHREETNRREWQSKKWQYEERVSNVLIEALDSDQDVETVKWIASNLDINLSRKKQYEVNVTFTIETEEDLDGDLDADWDFSFSVDHHFVSDYSYDVVWSKVESL